MSNIECMNDANSRSFCFKCGYFSCQCDSAIEYRYAYDREDFGGAWIFKPRPV